MAGQTGGYGSNDGSGTLPDDRAYAGTAGRVGTLLEVVRGLRSFMVPPSFSGVRGPVKLTPFIMQTSESFVIRTYQGTRLATSGAGTP